VDDRRENGAVQRFSS